MAKTIHQQTQSFPEQNLSRDWRQSPTIAGDFYSLIDAVDSEFVADQFGVGTYTNTHDFANHLRVGIFEAIDPFDTLAELAEKTATHAEVEEMAASTFSRHTNNRDYRAVVRVFFELLRYPNCIINAVFNESASSGSIEQSSLSTEQISHLPGQSLSRVNCRMTRSWTRSSQVTVASSST
ncbi:hypothetical protein HALLA_01035 (plasmid) [Halostagnicola larsenii XH-48]|uniref:Uncharacterized protein n=1 Tax=Halostagnicola larsenii XH-48 TaxID=797299 RepID=W0JXG6_9EURY|nr:hypothetical protein HALLA_01035 [Halostagnicola larsenii XH-48]